MIPSVMLIALISSVSLENMDASGHKMDLEKIWQSESTSKSCDAFRLVDIYQRVDKNILYNSVMCGPESLGNFLSVYVESTICANLTGLHVVSLKKKTAAGEPEALPDFFPKYIYNYERQSGNFRSICLCTNDICHEHPNALIHSHPSMVRDILRPAVLRHHQTWLSETSTYSRPIVPWKSTLRPPYSVEGAARLPLVPEAAIHYRSVFPYPFKPIPSH
jgi:hypothetical protein